MLTFMSCLKDLNSEKYISFQSCIVGHIYYDINSVFHLTVSFRHVKFKMVNLRLCNFKTPIYESSSNYKSEIKKI